VVLEHLRHSSPSYGHAHIDRGNFLAKNWNFCDVFPIKFLYSILAVFTLEND